MATSKTKKSPRRRTTSATTSRSSTARSTGKTRGARGGLQQPVRPDDALAAVVGNKQQPRSDIIKRLWSYIKDRGLQDSKDRRMINADATLQRVLDGKRKVSMFEMTRLVNQHVSPA